MKKMGFSGHAKLGCFLAEQLMFGTSIGVPGPLAALEEYYQLRLVYLPLRLSF